MWLLAALLDRVFPREEINGNGRCPTYLYRWRVFRLCGAAVYVHRFVGDDWCLDLHDHPKRFVSLMFFGSYVETTGRGRREYAAPFLRSFPASHAHRTELSRHAECWTLVLVWAAVRRWGFWHRGVWYHWLDYVRGRYSHLADSRAACEGIEGGDR